MIKTIFKEGSIVLLLCIAILAVLSVLFYDYNPVTKVIPSIEPYTTPENIKNKIEEENVESEVEMQNKVYTIEGSDLNIYKKSNAYNPSKENPFVSTTVDAGNTNVTNTSKTNTTNNTNTNNNNQTTNGQTTTANTQGQNTTSGLK